NSHQIKVGLIQIGASAVLAYAALKWPSIVEWWRNHQAKSDAKQRTPMSFLIFVGIGAAVGVVVGGIAWGITTRVVTPTSSAAHAPPPPIRHDEPAPSFKGR